MNRGERFTLTTTDRPSPSRVRTQLDHCARPAARLAQHEPVDRDDEARLLGERHEAVGHDDAARRVLPADERLGRDDAPVVSSISGWNCTTSSSLSIARHRSPSSSRRSIIVRRRLRIEELPAGAAVVLRDVHREVATGAAGRARAPGRVRDRDPDARRHEQLVIADDHRLAQALDDAVGDVDRDVGIGEVRRAAR